MEIEREIERERESECLTKYLIRYSNGSFREEHEWQSVFGSLRFCIRSRFRLICLLNVAAPNPVLFTISSKMKEIHRMSALQFMLQLMCEWGSVFGCAAMSIPTFIVIIIVQPFPYEQIRTIINAEIKLWALSMCHHNVINVMYNFAK